MKKVSNVKLKCKIWDEFGKPVNKIKGSPKDIMRGLKDTFKKYK